MRTWARALISCWAILIWGAPFAKASLEHPGIVSENPVARTPELLSTPTVPAPHIDAIAQLGNTIFVGGLFDEVVTAGVGNVHARNNFMAFDAVTGSIRTDMDLSFDGQIWAIEPLGTRCLSAASSQPSTASSAGDW